MSMLPNNVRKVWPPLPDEGEWGGEDRGMECRKCGCRHLIVYCTRQSVHMVVRYRRCRHCGQTMTTYERPIPSNREPILSKH